MSGSETLILILCVCLATLTVLMLGLYLLIRQYINRRFDEQLNDIENQLDSSEDRIADRSGIRIGEIRSDIRERLRSDMEENRKNRVEVASMLKETQENQAIQLERISDKQAMVLSRMDEKIEKRLNELEQKQMNKMDEFRDKTEYVLKTSITELQNTNQKKLDDIQTGINERLDTGLNERLDSSFKSVGEQLNRLYVSLGELGKLGADMSNLNRTLSNAKIRGVFGETQLENILANILSPSLYEKNVVTKKSEGHNRDAVEFAVKIPDKETADRYMYLPIDSKFPADVYERIRMASEEGNVEDIRKAVKDLEIRIREEARDIQTKYLDPPATTDFALLFLPTESLYAEVLRIPGLVEDLQKKNHIIVTGPTTIAALLNSLSVGFRYMAVNRDSQNILKLLSAIKSQYATLSKLIETASNRIELARKATGEMQYRTDIINKRLSAVEELDPIEAQSLLGLSREETVEQETE